MTEINHYEYLIEIDDEGLSYVLPDRSKHINITDTIEIDEPTIINVWTCREDCDEDEWELFYTAYADETGLNRDDGPAVIYSRSEFYYKNGSLHRVRKPAEITPSKDGYWRNGHNYRNDFISGGACRQEGIL